MLRLNFDCSFTKMVKNLQLQHQMAGLVSRNPRFLYWFNIVTTLLGLTQLRLFSICPYVGRQILKFYCINALVFRDL